MVRLDLFFSATWHDGAVPTGKIGRLYLFGTSPEFKCCWLVGAHKGDIHVWLNVFLKAHAPKNAINDAPAHTFTDDVLRGTLRGAKDAPSLA